MRPGTETFQSPESTAPAALLQLCHRLERAWTLPDVLSALEPLGEQVLGYRHTWLGVCAPDDTVRVLQHVVAGDKDRYGELIRQVNSIVIPIASDPMMVEIMQASHIVVVEDARTDPRTNKDIVAHLGNRTIINVPLVMADQRIGCVGMGTYGDEGVQLPAPWQLDLMRAMAGHVAVALDRVRFMEERRQAQDALQREKERLQTTLHSISDAVISTDAGGRILYLNPVAEALTGWRLADAVGRACTDVLVLSESAGNPSADGLGRAIANASAWQHAQLGLQPLGGSALVVDLAVSPLLAHGGTAGGTVGNMGGAVVVLRDVTEQHRLRREVEFQANHDALTHLGNRHAFERALAQACEAAKAGASSGARAVCHTVCYLDLDEFKVINDTCGHTAGDELLKQVARLFQSHLQPGDLLCRLGGDEFGIFLCGQGLTQALLVAERIQQALSAFHYQSQGNVFRVGVSIGMVVLDAASESVGALLQAADSACYVAKDAGRNRIHVYAVDDPALAQRYGVMEWVSRIEDALQHDRFVLFGQVITPLAPTSPGGAAGLHCEILLRMHMPDGQLASPAQFMPAVERYHLATRVDRWVIQKALAWMAIRQDRVGLCSINLSGHSLGDAGFLDFVLRSLDHTPVHCEKLCFEITETSVIGSLETAHRFITALRSRGCRFALDDFGSGFSSYAYLRQLPVDILKIDGQFVKGLEHDPINLAMVRSIHEIGCIMGKQTVAEFVESQATLDILADTGIHYAQGYAIGRPQPLDTLL